MDGEDVRNEHVHCRRGVCSSVDMHQIVDVNEGAGVVVDEDIGLYQSMNVHDVSPSVHVCLNGYVFAT